MPRVRRRGHRLHSTLDPLEVMLSGPEGDWTPQQWAEIEAILERDSPRDLESWRRERAEYLKRKAAG